MAATIDMLDLFNAIESRWGATDLATEFTGVFGGTADPLTPRPYAVVKPDKDSQSATTNKGAYGELTFGVEVVHDNLQEATRLAYLVQSRLSKPPLDVTAAGRLVRLIAGDVSWVEEDQYWRVIADFRGVVGRSRLEL
jgi:hypothetical protein